MSKTREEIQEEALQSARTHNYNGVLVLEPGSGKSKVAIDCIKQGNFKNILITSPRTNLKENWKLELEKWGIYNWTMFGETDEYDVQCGLRINITLENIQTVYKWPEAKLKSFDLIIYDELHTCGPEYYRLIEIVQKFNIDGDIHQKASVPIIGLTGTPTKSDPWKKEVLYKTLSIIYEYYNAEKDGVTNKISYQVFEYELSDNYKVITGNKDKQWLIGEKKQYDYLSEQYELAKSAMFLAGAVGDYFSLCLLWMRGNFTKEQKNAGFKFFYAIRNRKEFLWNLESSKQIALKIKNKILEDSVHMFSPLKYKHSYENKNNKVLLFSELTSQAEKLSSYSIHSNNGKSAKDCKEINKELLDKFNKGEIRELSSVNSLTLGLNLTNTTHAIFESYSSSLTNFTQKAKRLARLKTNDVANVIIIRPLNTQMGDSWFNSITKNVTYQTINKLEDLKI
jgi:superfamily II DNA or RNA helicase